MPRPPTAQGSNAAFSHLVQARLDHITAQHFTEVLRSLLDFLGLAERQRLVGVRQLGLHRVQLVDLDPHRLAVCEVARCNARQIEALRRSREGAEQRAQRELGHLVVWGYAGGCACRGLTKLYAEGHSKGIDFTGRSARAWASQEKQREAREAETEKTMEMGNRYSFGLRALFLLSLPLGASPDASPTTLSSCRSSSDSAASQ